MPGPSRGLVHVDTALFEGVRAHGQEGVPRRLSRFTGRPRGRQPQASLVARDWSWAAREETVVIREGP